jgi:hypothetical protein
MTTGRHLIAALSVIVLTGCGIASGSSTESPAEGIEQAAWLAGHWRGEGLGGWNEALWSPPTAGTMMGVFRHVKEGRVVFYELLTLAPRGDTLVLSLKHFNPDMTGWEHRDTSVQFALRRADRNVLEFEGLTYRRVSDDIREVTVMLGPDSASRRPEIFTYRRVQ